MLCVHAQEIGHQRPRGRGGPGGGGERQGWGWGCASALSSPLYVHVLEGRGLPEPPWVGGPRVGVSLSFVSIYHVPENSIRGKKGGGVEEGGWG